MPPAIIANYPVAIAIIRQALAREAADRRDLLNRLAMCAAALAVAALTAGAAASSVDLTAGAYTVAVVKLAAGCALSALFASLSGALFDAAEG